MAFNTPAILGGTALKGDVSCGTCHINGTSNGKLFIPGLSIRPGGFDTSSALFNQKAENSVLDPVRVPSLRGARFLSPYGNDGQKESLRDFVRTVIVDEFSGPDPAPAVLDAIVAYIEDIDFLPNPRITIGGKLAAGASEAEKRGEALFKKPFPHDAELSCAGCHIPSAAFVDNKRHDVGSGGLYKTPTLLNANFNAPYFHDVRFATLDQVVDYFDRSFTLGYSEQDRADAWLPISRRSGMPRSLMNASPRRSCCRIFSISRARSAPPFRRMTMASSRSRSQPLVAIWVM